MVFGRGCSKSGGGRQPVLTAGRATVYVLPYVAVDGVYVHLCELSGGQPERRRGTLSALLTTPPPERDSPLFWQWRHAFVSHRN